MWALELLQKCENFFGIIVLHFVGCLLSSSSVGLMATCSKRTYAPCCASQVCCSQSPCVCSRPVLTCASAGDTQTLKGRCGLFSCGGHCSCPWVLCPLSISGGYEVCCQTQFLPSYCLVGASPLPLHTGYLFLVGSNILLLMLVQQLVESLVFLQEKMSTHPFTPPSWLNAWLKNCIRPF